MLAGAAAKAACGQSGKMLRGQAFLFPFRSVDWQWSCRRVFSFFLFLFDPKETKARPFNYIIIIETSRGVCFIDEVRVCIRGAS